MKFLLLIVVCIATAAYAEPPRRFFARQEAAPGYNYGPPPSSPKPSNGYNYPTPAYGLPEPAPEEPTTPYPEATTEEGEQENEVETVENPQIEDAQAEQFKRANLRQKIRKARPLKLVAVPEPQYQQLVYYQAVPQTFARFEQQPIAVPVAVPQQGFSYSTQVFQQSF